MTGSASVIVNGGTISRNFIKATTGQNVCGGAIYIENGTGTINGGTITQNYTQTDATGKEAVGGAIFVNGQGTSQSTLTINGGSITNNYATVTTNGALGGAIAVVGANASATITGGTISRNYALSTGKDAYGGAVVVRDSARLTMNGGTISDSYAKAQTAKTGTTFRYVYGGAIAIVDSAEMTLSGGTITGNYAEHTGAAVQVKGAGIFIGYNNTNTTLTDPVPGTLNISGNPSFGTGNMLKTALSGATNGGEAYNYPRQDIYIPAISDAAPYIVVTGNISSPAGSIWIYAPIDSVEAKQHYKVGQQFAVIQDGVSVSDSSLLAFRDAQDDSTTTGSARSDYLTGIKGDNPAHVYWGIPVQGSRKVILRKAVKDTYVPLENAVFTIYKVKGSTVMVLKGVELKDLQSMASGVYFIGELPYGTYYIKETTVPDGYTVHDTANQCNWFKLQVGLDGVTVQLDTD